MTDNKETPDLFDRIYDELSDAIDLLDLVTADYGSEDSLGQAELALVRARDVMVSNGVPSLIAAAPDLLAALEAAVNRGYMWDDDPALWSAASKAVRMAKGLD